MSIKTLLYSGLAGLVIACILIYSFPQLTAPTASRPDSYANMVSRASPGVVNIYTKSLITQHPLPSWLADPFLQQFFGNSLPKQRIQKIQSSLGSGVVMDKQGTILTNYHVVRNAKSIEIALQDGSTYTAALVGADPETDIAVLHIDAPNLTRLPQAKQPARTGDIVFALGNPFGLGQTLSMGIVSAVGRGGLGLATFEHFIQTDAAVNQGNSGGALLNTDGELIGINTAIFSQSGGFDGISFAIPIDLAQHVMQQILTQGRVIRGYLGVETQRLNPHLQAQLTQSQPALAITAVAPNSPAQQAGLQQGDLLISINGQPAIDGTFSLYQIAALTPGTALDLVIQRQAQRYTVRTIVGERPVTNRKHE